MKEVKNGSGNGNGSNGNGVKNGAKHNGFNQVLESLMEGAQGVLTSRTVVGEPIKVGDTIIIPLSDVSIGVGAGSNGAERKDGGMGGFSAKMTPTAVLVIKHDITKVVNIRDQTSLTHIMDMVPEVIEKIRSRNTPMMSDEEAVNTAFPEMKEPGEMVQAPQVAAEEGASKDTKPAAVAEAAKDVKPAAAAEAAKDAKPDTIVEAAQKPDEEV